MNILTSLGIIWSILWQTATEEARSLRETLIFMVISLYIVVVTKYLVAAFPVAWPTPFLIVSVLCFFGTNTVWRREERVFFLLSSFITVFIFWYFELGDFLFILLSVVFWGISIYLLANIRRLASVVITGEAIELIGATDKLEGLTANQLSEMYVRLILWLFFFQTFFSLLIPFIPIHNDPVLLLIGPMIATLLVFVLKSSTYKLINLVASVLLATLILIHLFKLSPSLQAITGAGQLKYYWPSDGVAKRVNTITSATEEQKRTLVEEDLDKINTWRHNPSNKGKDLPEVEQKFFDQARKGGLKTLEEVREEIKNPPPPKSASGRNIYTVVRSTANGRGVTFTFVDRGIYTMPAGTKVEIGAITYYDPANPYTIEIKNSNQLSSVTPKPDSKEVIIEKN